MDAELNLYVADTGNQRIRKISGGTIVTVAGDGVMGLPSDGPATQTHLSSPWGVAVDASGNCFIADTYNHCVREVSDGAIKTIAGSGQFQYSGDGGPATSASLLLPMGLAFDSSGNLYIADWFDQRVRVVSHGTIETLAGNGTSGFSGDGGPARAAQLNRPVNVTADSGGSVYIADSTNIRIRKVSAGFINTVAGHGIGGLSGDGGPADNAQLGNPAGLAIDARGNLYIADTNNHTIRVISQGVIVTVAGNGTAGYSGDGGVATNAHLSSPLGVAVDATGNFYIADRGNNFVRKVSGGIITTVEGGTVNPQVTALAAGFPSASQAARTVFAPGEILSIYGTSLCLDTQVASLPLPYARGGCTVWFDSKKLALYYASPGQINAVLPHDAVAGGHGFFVVRYTDLSTSQWAAQSDNFEISIAPVSMNFVEAADGRGTVVAVQFEDGGFASDARPVKPGDTVTLYLTGLGAKSQPFADGAAPGITASAIERPEILVEGATARILYAGVQPQYPGLDEIVLQLPQYTLPAGKQTVTLTIRAPSVSQPVTCEVRAIP